jgi:4,4'-diaponeurosporenoate glycosyltransferase
MIALLLAVCGAGAVCGALLLRKAATLPPMAAQAGTAALAIIIPARNEEHNLPRLLASIRSSLLQPAELAVVDDGSTDATAALAASYGANVIACQPLPQGWTGKCWACWQGAEATTSGTLLFLDADTFFADGGLERMVALYQQQPLDTACSLLPYHAMERAYEQLSLFFNLLMAAGAGGWSGWEQPRLFGQALLLPRALYLRAGGHAQVRGCALENLHFAGAVVKAGGTLRVVVGKGVLHMRMFPEGFTQMWQSWRRGAAAGASATGRIALLLAIPWLCAITLAALAAATLRDQAQAVAVALYLVACAEVYWMARRLGSFGWFTALLYPVPLLFYFTIFAGSAWALHSGAKATWRGRQL